MKDLLINTYLTYSVITSEEKKKIVNYFKDSKLIYTDKKKSIAGALDCSDSNIVNNRISKILDKEELLKDLELAELNLKYRYTTLFKIVDFNESKDYIFENIISKSINVSDIKNLSDCCDKSIPNFILLQDTEDYIILKINYIVQHEFYEKSFIKYPILLLFYKKEGIIEIRLHKLPDTFKYSDSVYSDYIEKVLAKAAYDFGFKRVKVNFRKIVSNIMKSIENESDNITDTFRNYSSAYGSNIRLKAADRGKNKFSIPIIGDIERRIKNDPRIYKHPEVVQALREILSKAFDVNDLSRVAISWFGNNNSSEYNIEFIHSYMGRDFSVLKYQKCYLELEDAKNVTRDIMQYDCNIEEIE